MRARAADTPALGDFTASARVVPIAALAIGVGALAAYVAAALLALIAFFTNLFYFQRLSLASASPAANTLGAAGVLVPVVGCLVIGVIARYGSDRIRGHGIPEALEAILIRGSRVQPRVALLKPISAAISIGSGGPFGAEGPIIMTGGAFGSMIAQLFHLTAAERKTLLVAGAAAGMSATFAAPVASVFLAVELLLFELKPRSLVPVALASVTAAFVRRSLLGAGPIFPLPDVTFSLGAGALVACAACGLGAGMLASLLTAAVYASEDAFSKLKLHWMWWPAIGGLAVGLGGLVCPQALGVGYDQIQALLLGGRGLGPTLRLMLVKAAIWSFSLGSGTSGGVLAPLLMMGAALGGLEARVFPDLGPGFWPLVSLAATLSGTMGAPLTALVFAIELTGRHSMSLPLLAATATAHAFTVLVLKRSILTEKIARRGLHVSREYAIDPLEILFAREVMTTGLALIPESASIEDALAATSSAPGASECLFPVVDRAGRFVGVVTRRDLERVAREWTEGVAAAAPHALDGVVRRDVVTARAADPLRVVVHRMADTGFTRVPVVDDDDPRRLVGMLTLKDLLKARARHLEEERRRERVLPLRAFLPFARRGEAPPV
ncbi:MAG TPA: chloride channel protein [Polyangia bacterium]|nr:chloride channel protein [Polyangia bacterium]